MLYVPPSLLFTAFCSCFCALSPFPASLAALVSSLLLTPLRRRADCCFACTRCRSAIFVLVLCLLLLQPHYSAHLLLQPPSTCAPKSIRHGDSIPLHSTTASLVGVSNFPWRTCLLCTRCTGPLSHSNMIKVSESRLKTAT